MVQTIKNLPAMQETQVQSLGQEDLEKGMATHSSIPTWRIPWTEETWQATVHGVTKSRTQLRDFTFTSFFSPTLSLSVVFPEAGMNEPVMVMGGLKKVGNRKKTW